MANPIVTGALCMCSFGAAPGTISATTAPLVKGIDMPIGTIMDKAVTPFGICAQIPTAPVPCSPVITSWVPGCPTVLVDKKPMLTNSCKGICAKGGVITFVSTPAMQIKTP